MSQVPSLCACARVYLCVNPNKGYPIQDKIRPDRPYTADGARVAKKSTGWCKPTEWRCKEQTRGSQLKWPANVRKSKATALGKVNEGKLGSWSESSCQVEEGEGSVLLPLLQGRCEHRQEDQSITERCMSFICRTDGQNGTRLNEILLLIECCCLFNDANCSKRNLIDVFVSWLFLIPLLRSLYLWLGFCRAWK